MTLRSFWKLNRRRKPKISFLLFRLAVERSGEELQKNGKQTFEVACSEWARAKVSISALVVRVQTSCLGFFNECGL